MRKVRGIASTRACSGDAPPRNVGTLVFAPSAGRDARISFSVVAGVTVPTTECAARGFKGCVIAKRRVRYFPGEPLTLPVDLSLSCLDIPCTEERTCSNGLCVPADVDDPAFCAGPGCARAGADGGVLVDAANVDAKVPSFDGGTAEGTMVELLPYAARGLDVDGTNLFVARVNAGQDLIEVWPLNPPQAAPTRTVPTKPNDEVYGVTALGRYEYFAGSFEDASASDFNARSARGRCGRIALAHGVRVERHALASSAVRDPRTHFRSAGDHTFAHARRSCPSCVSLMLANISAPFVSPSSALLMRRT